MTTTTQKTDFITIPSVGRVASYSLDPLNRVHVASLIRRAEAYFSLSAKAWESGNNSGNAATLRASEVEERETAANGEALLAPLGIKCDWPGLYPSFEVGGFHEYTTEAAVLAALGHPRNWLTS